MSLEKSGEANWSKLLPSGVQVRPFRGKSDLSEMLAVIRSSQDADGADVTSPEEIWIRNGYDNLPQFDPAEDIAIVEADRRMIAFARLWREEEIGQGRVFWHTGYVIPDWRSRGIGRALLRFLQARAMKLASSAVEDEPLGTLTTHVHNSEVATAHLLRSEGYGRVRAYFDMVHPGIVRVEPVRLPDGLELRPVRSEDVRAIWNADQESLLDHWGFAPATEEDYQAWVNSPLHQQRDLWRVAWDGDEVAGQVRSFIDAVENERFGRARGHTENVSVRRPWRRRGLARALMLASMAALRERGMTEAALGVDVESLTGAVGLYQSLGFEIVQERPVYRRPLELVSAPARNGGVVGG